MSHTSKILLLTIISTLFTSVYGQSRSEIESSIRDEKSPLERSLQAIDKLHVSKLDRAEEKMALLPNIKLQEDLYKRMASYKSNIKKYSKKVNGEKTLEQFKVYLADYNSKLVRIISIFFNFHKNYAEKFGLYGNKNNFLSMKAIRGLNLVIAKAAFEQISDLVNMKAKHVSDDEIEIQIKEMEYVQIASSTYLSNAVDTKKDFAHLVQFTATQQTLVNRGQLSAMDGGLVLNEKPVNSCMKRNLYLGEQENFKISEHALNREDLTSSFYSKFYQASEPILEDLADEKFFTITEAHETYQIIKDNGLGQAWFSEENAISKIEESISAQNADPNRAEKLVEFKDLTEEQKAAEIKGYYNYLDQTVPKRVYDLFKNFFNNQKLVKHIPLSLLSGDKIDKKAFVKRARKSYESDFYNALAEFVRKIEQTEGRVNLDVFAPTVTRMMNKWQSKLEVIIDRHVPKFSATTSTKSEALNTYVEQEVIKAFPYAKAIYFSRFAEKAGDKVNEIYNNHAEKASMKLIPDNPNDLMSLAYDKPLVKDYELCPEVADKVTSNFFQEVQQAYNELLPFTELAGANPNNFFYKDYSRIVLDNEKLDKVIFAHLGDFVEKRAYPKAKRDKLYNTFMTTIEAGFNKYFEIEVNEVVFNSKVFHKVLSSKLKKSRESEPFLNELKSAIYPKLEEIFITYSSALLVRTDDLHTPTINQEKVLEVVAESISKHVKDLGYPVDNKNRIYLQKQFAELAAYADSGDEKYLSDRMKRYLISKSGHRGGKYSKGTAKAILQAGNSKRVYNSLKGNESTESIISSLKKTSIHRENLLWNITLWKLADYAKGFNLQYDIVHEINGGSPRDKHENLLKFKDNQNDRKKLCKISYNNSKKQTLRSDISAYSQEQVKIVSYKTKSKMTTSINYERPEDLFKEGDHDYTARYGHITISNRQGYRKIIARLAKRFGMQEGYKDAIVATSTASIKNKYWLSAKRQALIAKNRLNELYGTSFLMRTPYKLGTTGETEPTAFRLLKAFDISRPNGFDLYQAKSVIKDTVRQALVNSKMLAENWCMADYGANGGNGETYFREIYRHAPLIREQLIAEIEMIESRRSKDSSKFITSLRKIDSFLDKDSKTTMERLHESIEMIAMIAGIIMIAAMLVWGVGFFVGATVFATGKAGMLMTMNHLIFAFFIVSFASRMHHIYLRVPSQLSLQHKIATTQILRPLYTNWDQLEEKIKENTHERTSGGQIAMHIGEGLFQGMFAFQIARIPYVRYSASKMVSILQKSALPVQKIVRPMHKSVKFVSLFKPGFLKGNWKSFKKSVENLYIKIAKPTEFIAGKTSQDVARVLDIGLRNRTYMIARKHANIFNKSKGLGDVHYLKALKKSLSKRIRRDSFQVAEKKESIKRFLDSFVKKTGMSRAKAAKYLNIEGYAFNNLDESAETVRKGMLLYHDLTTAGTKVMRNGTWFEEAGYAINHWLKRRQFMTRSYIKRFQKGTLGKDLKGSGIQAELDDAFNAMMKKLDDAKDEIKRSMIKKIDQVEMLTKSTKAEHEIFRGRDAMEILFDPRLVNSPLGEIAFTSAEVQQYIMTSMTSIRFGSLGAKLDYMGLMMMDYPILMRRLKSQEDFIGKLPRSIIPENQPIMLMAAKEVSSEATQAGVRTEEIFGSLGDEFNHLIDKLFKPRITKKDTMEIVKALSERKELYGDAAKFKQFVDNKVKEILERNRLKIGKRSIRNVTALASVLMLQEEISYRYDQLKTAWKDYADSKWGFDKFSDLESFERTFDEVLESDLLTDEQAKALADEFEGAFRENYETIEELEKKYEDFENFEEVKAKLYELLNNGKPAKVQYIEDFEALKEEARSLGLSYQLKKELELVEEVILKVPSVKKEYEDNKFEEYFGLIINNFEEKPSEDKTEESKQVEKDLAQELEDFLAKSKGDK